MATDSNGRLRFGAYEFDFQARKLFRDAWPVKLQPQPLRVLSVLIEHRGEIVSREQLRTTIWGDTTFVEFDQGLNYCIRQIRVALRDDASQPYYIQTLPKQGYRFIADVALPSNGANAHANSAAVAETEPGVATKEVETARQSEAATIPSAPPPHKHRTWAIAAGVLAMFATTGLLYHLFRPHAAGISYTQLTDFTDSATAPALSPDGRMLAFIRSDRDFLTADQIYVKMLPDGEARRLTNDGRLKYHLAFSPDGSQIAYTVLDNSSFSTYVVSVLGGDSHLLLNNAAGLTWLDQNQLLFSQARSGVHLGVVTATVTRDHLRELYFPAHERGMAHYSYASPDHKTALVVEMNEHVKWAMCRLISLDGHSGSKPIGPLGACTAAGWSPDGSWMYFIAAVEGRSHLWRQRYPNGQPEQLTFGPTEEEGLAVAHDGRSLITSMGAKGSAIWIHDAGGERALSSEGEVDQDTSPPTFSVDGKDLYYLLRRRSSGLGAELWRMSIDTGKSEAVFPGTAIVAYDVSPDGKQVVYSTGDSAGKSRLWIAPIDRAYPAKQIGDSGETLPHFGPRGEILFQMAVGASNYVEQMNQDGSHRSRTIPYPILDIQSISPGRKWLIAGVAYPNGKTIEPQIMAIPLEGGPPRRLCVSFCRPIWSSGSNFLFIPVEASSQTSPGRSLAIPVGPGEELPELPVGGIKPLAEAAVVPGAQSIPRDDLVPGTDLSHFAYVKTTVHRNLYRVSLP
jgi:DNA-binding winged helix-turn-helix (wHTH) protein/Tol biopolymer transport system component